MKQYLDLMRHVLTNGVDKHDRTGTGTRSVFGAQMRFNLSEGFPLLTTKRVHFHSVVHELLWFLRGDTNVRYLQENGVRIWNEWRRPWPSNRPLVCVEPRPRERVPYNGDYSFAGVNASAGSVEGKLAAAWKNMLRRCYDPTAHNYKHYGAKGASVCKHWHDASTFIRDVQNIPHWEYKLRNWNSFELDKDYWGANHYSPDTCIWLPKSENVPNTPFGIVFPDGTEQWFLSYAEAAEQTGISKTSLYRFVSEGLPSMLKGATKRVAGWEFIPHRRDGSLVRRALVPAGDLGPVYGKQWRSWEAVDGRIIDQLSDVINQIKTNPDSRRLIVSAWNVGELDQMALPPCHLLFQFYVAHGRLSCQLYQRSADLFLGVPFNIASYALLTHLIAHECGLGVGEFVWTGGDVHLYSNHFGQAKEQLIREPRDLPDLHLSDRRVWPGVFKLRASNIWLENYDPYPAIKAPVAV